MRTFAIWSCFALWRWRKRRQSSQDAPSTELMIPAGTKVPVALKHAISTKGAREGDPIYAETTFPVVLNDRVLIPANTFVQGRISNIKRPGRIKGRAEILITSPP